MNEQSVSRNCFVCGVENQFGLHMRFFETPPNELGHVQVKAEYTAPAHYQGWPGVTHGGILATMLDEVTSRTIFRGDTPRFVVTANLSIRYRKPVPVEIPLKLSGHVIEDKGRVIKVAGEIRNEAGDLLAEAEALIVEVDPSFFGEFTSEDMQSLWIPPNGHQPGPVGQNQTMEER